MNKIKHVVTEVVGEPEYHKWIEQIQDDESGDVTGQRTLECWTLEVKADSYGRIGEHTLTFDTKEEALKVEEGYTFTA